MPEKRVDQVPTVRQRFLATKGRELAPRPRGMLGCVLLAAAATALAGCGNQPVTGTYSAECAPVGLGPGRTQDIELTVQFLLPKQPKVATRVTYQARLTAPPSWSVGGGDWEYSRTMKTNDMGFREARLLRVAVPAEVAPGGHALKLLISPAAGTPQTLELRLPLISREK